MPALGAVEREGGRGQLVLVEVDAEQGGIFGSLLYHQPVDHVRLPDHPHLVALLRQRLADEQHVREEEAADVHLRRGGGGISTE